MKKEKGKRKEKKRKETNKRMEEHLLRREEKRGRSGVSVRMVHSYVRRQNYLESDQSERSQFLWSTQKSQAKFCIFFC